MCADKRFTKRNVGLRHGMHGMHGMNICYRSRPRRGRGAAAARASARPPRRCFFVRPSATLVLLLNKVRLNLTGDSTRDTEQLFMRIVQSAVCAIAMYNTNVFLKTVLQYYRWHRPSSVGCDWYENVPDPTRTSLTERARAGLSGVVAARRARLGAARLGGRRLLRALRLVRGVGGRRGARPLARLGARAARAAARLLHREAFLYKT